MNKIDVQIIDAEGYVRQSQIRGVMPAIRDLKPNETMLFPYLETDAVRAACCLLRQKEGINVRCKSLYRKEGLEIITVTRYAKVQFRRVAQDKRRSSHKKR